MGVSARSYRLGLLGFASLCSFVPTAAMAGDANESAPPKGTSASSGIRDIVVTARRREESAQTVPVSVTAFSAEELATRGVQLTQDLNVAVPGFRYSGIGGKSNMEIVMRGLTQTPIGEGTPATIIYMDEVPLPNKASNIPFFDIASTQVLKGPQGTLFGRNSLGGAVLVTPNAPSYTLEGYLKGAVGNYSASTLEGAFNLPIVDEKIALRVGGQVRRRDGFVQNLSGGPDFNDLNQKAFRASLLIQPTDAITNTVMFTYFRANERQTGSRVILTQPGIIPGLSELVDPGIADYVAQEQAAGFYSSFSDLGPGNDKAYRRQWIIQNKTEVQIGSVTAKNIFSLTHVDRNDIVGPTGLDVIPTVAGPFYLYSGQIINERKYLTEELQFSGNSFDDKLTWIVGAFYSKDSPNGLNGTVIRAFTFSPEFTGYGSAHVKSRNVSLFGQIALDLSDIVTPGLTFNAGFRYSWDKVSACAGVDPSAFLTVSQCNAIAARNLPDGYGIISAKGSAPSWTVGLDYKVNDDLFLYFTSRRGYRGVNVNTPLFETPYTTGAVIVPPEPGGPGCTGPGNICPDLRGFQTIKPEKLTDFEFGIKSNFRAGDVDGRFNIAAFLSKYKNALEVFNVGFAGIYAGAPDFPTQGSVGINAADETIWGIEAELALKPTSTLSLNFNGAYNHAKVDRIAFPPTAGLAFTKSDVTLPTPEWTGSASFSWTTPLAPLDGDVVLHGDYFVTSKYGGSFGRYLPGYNVVNGRLAWQNIAQKGLDLAIFARNLLKEKYILAPDVLSPAFPINSGTWGEPRTYGVEARVTF